MTHPANSGAASELRSFIERVERLEEEKRTIADDIKSVYAEAKARGFDPKIMRRVVADRKMDRNEREEMEALVDLYRHALGMDGDTPLGEAARKRMSATVEPAADPTAQDDQDADAPDGEGAPSMPAMDAAVIEQARERGRQAARDGVPILSNPYLSDDPRRAAWDEGWCAESGSDGMDIPETWRRRPRKKKGDE